jgi:hypothetical protein
MIIYAEERLRRLFTGGRCLRLRVAGSSANSIQFLRDYKIPLSMIYGEPGQCNPFTLVCPVPLPDFFRRGNVFYLREGVFFNGFQNLRPQFFYVPEIFVKSEKEVFFPHNSFAVLNDRLADDSFSERVPSVLSDDLFAFMTAVINGSRSLKTAQDMKVPSEIMAICGCGPGLTPSGDDFLCGLFLCLRLLGVSGCLDFSLHGFCRQTFFYTNRLSAAFLRSAILGYCSLKQYELLHAFKRDCLTNKLLSDFKFGHYSALDFLQGVRFAGQLFQQFFVQTGNTDSLP